MKLVAYFSTSGNTAQKARELAKELDADFYEITPLVPYTADDLDWQDRGSRSNAEMEDNKTRPSMAGTMPDISKYDEIYLGFPLWWGKAPRIINTFLEGADFTGKKIIPFATSGGSEYGKASDDLIPSAPGAIFEEGKRIK
ncbi:MAG: flavodoxin [Clostridiales bacterium]|nr:flavodoxin [Clostridiales bacterium]